MTINELISRIEHNIIAWHMMVSPSPSLQMIQPDSSMIDEARSECFRAVYDTIREFEYECVKRGYERARGELANGIVGQKGNDFIAATAAFLSR